MQKFRWQSNIFIVAIIIALTIGVVFIALISINWTLIIGWTIGTIVTLINQLMTVIFLDYLFKNKNSKEFVTILGYSKIFITFIFHSICFISIIAINKYFNGANFWEKNVKYMYSPINVFTYIGGISLITISTLVTQLFDNKKGKKWRNQVI